MKYKLLMVKTEIYTLRKIWTYFFNTFWLFNKYDSEVIIEYFHILLLSFEIWSRRKWELQSKASMKN